MYIIHIINSFKTDERKEVCQNYNVREDLSNNFKRKVIFFTLLINIDSLLSTFCR